MARARVKPEDRKNASGAPPSIDLDAYDKMADDLLAWVETAPLGSTFGDFICYTSYTYNQVAHAEKVCEKFAQKLFLAKRKLAAKWRQFGMEKNSGFARMLLPLVDKEYKEWRMTELKLQAAANADPKRALEEIMNKSENPIKDPI